MPVIAAPAPVSSAPGELKLIVKPWAFITLDAAELGYSPIPPRSVAAGKHKVTFKNQELGKEIVREIDVPAGETVTVRIDMMKEH